MPESASLFFKKDKENTASTSSDVSFAFISIQLLSFYKNSLSACKSKILYAVNKLMKQLFITNINPSNKLIFANLTLITNEKQKQKY